MQAKFVTAVLLSFVLITASACGGGGSDDDDLRTSLEEAEQALEEAEKARKEAEEKAAEADRKRKEAEQAREEPEEPTEEPAEEAEDETEEAEEPKAQQPAQTLEANQRAEKLLTTLQGVTPADPGTGSRVTITVPSRNKLTFEQSDYRASSISAPGLRGAKLTRSRGGTQTTVVYTDIELSRSLIKNYDTDAADDAETIPAADITGLGGGNFLAGTDAFVITGHGFPSSKTADATIAAKMGASFSGSLNGVGGKFECATDDCMTLTPTYTDNKLTEIGVTGIATFKPTSRTATVSLCNAPKSQCASTDADYIAFGWWRSEPASAQGTYQFEPFAFGPTLVTTDPASNAEYNGTAVGMYVEQQQEGSAIAKKQGEFVADARLDWNGSELTGTVDSFKTTPTGGSSAPSTTGWVVKLNAGDATVLELHGPDGAGTWKHAYTTDGSAVVGTFGSEVEDVLNIVGAFGARKQQ